MKGSGWQARGLLRPPTPNRAKYKSLNFNTFGRGLGKVGRVAHAFQPDAKRRQTPRALRRRNRNGDLLAHGLHWKGKQSTNFKKGGTCRTTPATRQIPSQESPVQNRIADVLIHIPWYSIDGITRLAEDAGVSKSAPCRLIAGQSSPSFSLVWKVTKALEKRLGNIWSHATCSPSTAPIPRLPSARSRAARLPAGRLLQRRRQHQA